MILTPITIVMSEDDPIPDPETPASDEQKQAFHDRFLELISDHGQDAFAGNVGKHTIKAMAGILNYGYRLTSATAQNIALDLAEKAFKNSFHGDEMPEDQLQFQWNWAKGRILATLARMEGEQAR